MLTDCMLALLRRFARIQSDTKSLLNIACWQACGLDMQLPLCAPKLGITPWNEQFSEASGALAILRLVNDTLRVKAVNMLKPCCRSNTVKFMHDTVHSRRTYSGCMV